MIRAFGGDPFLVRRAALAALHETMAPGDERLELGEGLDADRLRDAAAQGGLFGRAVLLLDFEAAFRGQAGATARTAVMKALEHVPEDAAIVAMDPPATPARQKRWRALGEYTHLPTPRFGKLRGWIAGELRDAGVDATPGVAALLADLFGEDLPGLASEIEKLAVLDGRLDEERVAALVQRPASRDAFDMIDAITAGDAATAVRTARLLLDAGDAPPRILGAIGWQLTLVAKAVAVRAREGDLSDGDAARALQVAPFPAGKAMKIARGLDEAALRASLEALQEAEAAVKTGARDPAWAVEALALGLAEHFARGAPGRAVSSRS